VPVKLKLREDDLVNILKLFCEAYEISSTDYDEKFLKKEGLNRLRYDNLGLNYKIFYGTEFFGNRNGNSIIFYWHKNINDKKKELKNLLEFFCNIINKCFCFFIIIFQAFNINFNCFVIMHHR